MALFTLARSSLHLNAISNRLSATSPRARSLGIFVGITISQLIDKPDARMTFSMDVANSTEAKWYISLTGIKDGVSSIQNLKKYESGKGVRHGSRNQKNASSKVPKKGQPVASKIVTIEEIDNEGGVGDGSDDDDLVAYQKPDSDEEDDGDDPTIVQRNKPTAPV